MRASMLGCCALLLASTASDAVAANHKVTLQAISSYKQELKSASGGWGDLTSITTPTGDRTCPEGSNPSGIPRQGVMQCQWSSLSTGGMSKVNSTTVRGLLTTPKGDVYDVSIFCQKTYGECPVPQNGSIYNGKLSEDAKWLARYTERPVHAPMHITIRPDGKRSVSYSIIFIMRSGSTQARPD